MNAAIFDYDGTLVHLNIDFNLMRQDVEKILLRYGIQPTMFDGYYVLEMIDEATKLLSKKNPSGAQSLSHESHEMVIKHEVEAAGTGKILPGMVDMLEQLEKRHVKVGIITRNCNRAVKTVFPDIDTLCDVYIPRDDVIHPKPHPEHLTLALRQLSLDDSSGCFMVGDHVSDIQAGKRVRMKTVGVLTGNTTHSQFLEAGADFVLEDATQIMRLVEEV